MFFLLDWPFIDVSWRASRALASARGLPRRRRARAVGRVLSGQKWFQPKGLPDGSAARRPRGAQAAAERRGPRTRRERVRGLPTAAQSCRISCAVLTDATRCAARWPRLQDGGLHGGGRRAPALGQRLGRMRRCAPSCGRACGRERAALYNATDIAGVPTPPRLWDSPQRS